MLAKQKNVVLVVDDSDAIRQLVAMTLRRAGFESLEAADGEQGLSLIESNRSIVAVICDINMPNMDGLEMLAQVKGKPENSSLPILMLTTEGQPALVKRAKAAGAAAWLVKPFSSKQLLDTLKRLAGD